MFLFAGIPKLFAVSDFAASIGAYGLVPESFLYPVALLLAVAEVGCAVGLLLRKKVALMLITGLMAIFIMVLIYGLWMGLDIDCGCFTADDPEFHTFSGIKAALIRDLLLFLPLLYLIRQTVLKGAGPQGLEKIL